MKRLTVIILFLLSLGAMAQEKALVHINADFNKSNDWYGLSVVSDVRVFGGYIDQNKDIQEKYNITKVPTLILYHKGKEVERWEAGLDMKLHVKVNEIQDKINKL